MSKKTDHPFPFFGAGHASYFEWAGLTIRFKQAPTTPQQKQISAGAPKIWSPEEHAFDGRILSVISDQFVNDYIEEAYGEVADDEGEYDPDYLDPEAAEGFEKDIERWLKEVHAVCSIEFVYRAEDGEAGGIEFSAWHKASLRQVKGLTDLWASAEGLSGQGVQEAAYFREAANGILEYAEMEADTLPSTLAHYLDPAAKIRELLNKGDAAAIKKYLQQVQESDHEAGSHDDILEAIDEYCEQLSDERRYALIYRLHFLFGKKKLQGPSIGPFIYAAWLNEDTKLIDDTLRLVGQSCEVSHNIGYFVIDQLFAEKKWQDAIQLFRIAINIKSSKPCTYLDVYCNALYVLQNDNTGLPVDHKLNEEFLTRCLPHAPKNPAIYFNAACLYAEMNDHEKTLECIQLAKEYKFEGYEAMMREIKKAGIFKKFLQYPPFKKYQGK